MILFIKKIFMNIQCDISEFSNEEYRVFCARELQFLLENTSHFNNKRNEVSTDHIQCPLQTVIESVDTPPEVKTEESTPPEGKRVFEYDIPAPHVAFIANGGDADTLGYLY